MSQSCSKVVVFTMANYVIVIISKGIMKLSRKIAAISLITFIVVIVGVCAMPAQLANGTIPNILTRRQESQEIDKCETGACTDPADV